MSGNGRFVVVGGGLAGAKAAETLRSEGFDGAITIVGAEADPPYERPPLSKGYLAGTQTRDSVFVHEQSWYADNSVELLLRTRAVGLDPAAHTVTLDGGGSLPFDKALLATGSSPRKVNLPGTDLDGVHYLRRIGDSERLASELSGGGRRVVVVGGGWIGLEVTATARGFGNDVVVVEPQRTVLIAALGQELGDVFAGLHRDHGVRLMLRDGVAEVRGADGRVSGVVTTSGEVLPADVVVVGVGARPNVELALQARLDTDDGVLTDATLRTSHPDVYAAGDIASTEHPLFGRRIRVEHWANALNGGPAAARSMLGATQAYDRLPYFYTDQYDLGMEYVGDVGPDGYDRVVYRGDLASRTFIAFWLRAGRVWAAMNVNVWDVVDDLQALIRSGAQVDPARLADPDVPLADSAAPVG
jgi:3-phenylpropionate/trans-cinnamate dioxygenase ferredoxin reductase component